MHKTGLILTAALSLLGGCATADLSEIDIAGITPVFVEEESGAPESLGPGREYEIRFSVTDRDGELIEKPNHAGYIVSSGNGTLALKDRKRTSLVLRTSHDGFRLIKDPQFSLTLGVEGDSFQTVFEWPVDWSAPTVLDYGGEDGSEGDEGRDGRSGDGGLFFDGDGNGGDGKSGDDGENGSDGKTAMLYAFYYDVSDLDIDGLDSGRMILLVDGSDGSANLVPPGEIVIDCRGGNGGRGGDGGDGGDAGTVETSSGAEYTGIRGMGGDGGDGGDGGNGGDILLHFSNPGILECIVPMVEGGSGGAGGSFGDGDTPLGFIAAYGFPGDDGEGGVYKTFPIAEGMADHVLSQIDNPLFDRSRVMTD